MRVILGIALALGFQSMTLFAPDLPGFPLEDFGNVVLSERQIAGSADYEASFGNYNNEPISN